MVVLLINHGYGAALLFMVCVPKIREMLSMT